MSPLVDISSIKGGIKSGLGQHPVPSKCALVAWCWALTKSSLSG